jgi:hypothetical protein
MRRSIYQRADRDIAAFLVVLGITALMAQVANTMMYEGVPRSWVPGWISVALVIADGAWISWRLREYERLRGR